MTDYNTMKVADLREELKRRGIASTGLTRKAQIVEAIEEDDSKAEPAASEEQELGATATEEPAEEAQETAAGEVSQERDDEPAAPEAENPVETTTPIVGSPAPEEASPESRKRKRGSQSRSASPSTAEAKKVKTAEDAASSEVKPMEPEDAASEVNELDIDAAKPHENISSEEVAEEAPAPVVGEVPGTDAKPDTTSIPMSTSDDTMEAMKDYQVRLESSADALRVCCHLSRMKKLMQRPQPDAQTQDTTEQSTTHEQDTEMEDAAPPSVHTQTRALYISNLVRPLQEQQLRDYLASTANGEGKLEDLYLDQLRTHAFATFTSLAAAASVRTQLHGNLWPDQTRKPLWVDYVPEDKVSEWISTEQDATHSKRDAKRWEITYEPAPTDTDLITAVLREIPTGPGQGMPNAPSGPRGARRPSNLTTTTTNPPATTTADDPISPLEPPTTHLDTLFESTISKPKIYFKPVSPTLREDRLKELDRETSQDWLNTGGAEVGGPLDQVKRYTFEDGDRLVDGGQDFGSFGRGGGTMGGERYAPRGGRGGGRFGRR
ncbi:hypothetical protein MBLNU230_g4884t1 [Neophaeotheca triangularis]